MTQRPTSPDEESARIEALRSCGVLDGETDPRFEEIASMACTALDTPHAMITVVEQTQQLVLSSVGCELGSTPRESSLGEVVIAAPADDDLFVLEDASEDPRFAAHPLVVGDAGMRFFAAAPLALASGHRLGMLAIFDRERRSPDARVRTLLPLLARRVVDLFELHRAASELAHAREHLESLSILIPMCSHCRRVRNEENVWQTLERLVQAKTGSRFTHGICPDCVRERYPDAAEDLLRGRHRHRRR